MPVGGLTEKTSLLLLFLLNRVARAIIQDFRVTKSYKKFLILKLLHMMTTDM